ncbi:hypothetical protein Hanom_Chr16g01513861 [Helianthus anomalus]
MDNPHFIQVENHKTIDGITYGRYDKLLVLRDCLLLVVMLQPLQVDVLAIVLGDREEDSFLVLEVPGIMLVKYNIMSKTFYQLCNLTRIQILPTKVCSFLFTPSLVGV